MKRVGFLYKEICSENNIKAAIIEASKNKRKRKEVVKVLNSLDFYIAKIREMLINKTFENSVPKIRYRFEKLQNKMREITVLPFYPDQIVHHAIIRVISKVIMRGMYYYSCANIPGRGEQRIRLHLSKALKHDPKNTKYCLKFDIRKFYPSIQKIVLIQKLQRVIKDKDTIFILNKIINVAENGLPLGSYSSQWLANFFLQDLDHFIKEELHVKYAYRYADDIVILGSNRRKLKFAFDCIKTYCEFEFLDIKDSWRIFRISKTEAIDFVGYKFYRNKISIRKRIFKNVRSALLKIKNKIEKRRKVRIKLVRSLMSYLGYIKNSNIFLIKKKYLAVLPIKQLKAAL